MSARASPACQPLCQALSRGAPCARWAGGCASAHTPCLGGARSATSWGAGGWQWAGGGWRRCRHPLARQGVGCRCGGEAGGGWGRPTAGLGSPAAPQLPQAAPRLPPALGPQLASAGTRPDSLQREGLRDPPGTPQPCSLGPLPPRDRPGTPATQGPPWHQGPQIFLLQAPLPRTSDTQGAPAPQFSPGAPTTALRVHRSRYLKTSQHPGPPDPLSPGTPCTQASQLIPSWFPAPFLLPQIAPVLPPPCTLHHGAARGPGRPHRVALTRHWCDEVSPGGDIVVGWAEGR